MPHPTTTPCSDSLSLRLHFVRLAGYEQLAGPLCKKYAVTGQARLPQLVGTRFQVLFHSPPGVLFTFPSRYWFTIGRQGVLSLTGWSPWIPTGFPVPGRTQVVTREGATFRIRGCYPVLPAFPDRSATPCLCDSPAVLRHDHVTPATPIALGPQAIARDRFGLIPFRSPLLGESRFLSFPPVTEMFHFTGLPSTALCVQAGIRAHYHAWVPPFGDPRVIGCSAPHRGLSQPSTSFIGS
jgi:hypothetical protein